jgi:hypothetical protein
MSVMAILQQLSTLAYDEHDETPPRSSARQKYVQYFSPDAAPLHRGQQPKRRSIIPRMVSK